MFTGLIEGTGVVTALSPLPGGGARLRVAWSETLGIGDSVAVNGACVTAVEVGAAGFAAELSPVTLAVTTLNPDDLRVGDRVNLERPLKVGDRLGGHWVTGHVDEASTVLSRERLADGMVSLVVALPPGGRGLVVDRGSVAVDGVSLTVVAVHSDRFELAIIPHTLAVTALGDREPSARVNLEYDILGKYARISASGYRGEDSR